LTTFGPYTVTICRQNLSMLLSLSRSTSVEATSYPTLFIVALKRWYLRSTAHTKAKISKCRLLQESQKKSMFTSPNPHATKAKVAFTRGSGKKPGLFFTLIAITNVRCHAGGIAKRQTSLTKC
jgi:hypothetical protein